MHDHVFEFTAAKVAEKGLIAAKRIGPKEGGALDVGGYGRAMWWFLKPMRCESLQDMAALLRKAALRPECCIVMGAPLAGIDLSRPHFKRWNNADTRTNSLQEVARAWLPIDIDGVDVPAPFGRAENLVAAGRWVRDNELPPEFCGVSCVVAPSAQTGLETETRARFRLFFLVTELHPLERLRLWADGARAAGYPVDSAVCRAGQPIYTARPVFTGMDDPVPAHLHAVVIHGVFGDRVGLVADRFDQHVDQQQRHGFAGGGFVSGPSDWREYLRQEVGGPRGFFAPLTSAMGGAAASEASDAEIVAYTVAVVAEHTATDPDRRRHYSAEWICKTVQRFRGADRMVDAEIARARARLFLRGMY